MPAAVGVRRRSRRQIQIAFQPKHALREFAYQPSQFLQVAAKYPPHLAKRFLSIICETGRGFTPLLWGRTMKVLTEYLKFHTRSHRAYVHITPQVERS